MDLKDGLLQILSEENVLFDEPMSRHTSFRIGGCAKAFVMVPSVEKLLEVLEFCKRNSITYYIVGNGSNLLVSDNGIDGVVIQIGSELSDIISIEELEDKSIINVNAGMKLSTFAAKLRDLGLTGFEFAAGIPGCIGGAIFMNAGAYGGEIKDCLISCDVIDNEGRLVTFTNEELELSYRSSIIQKNGYIIVRAKFAFVHGDSKEITQTMQELARKRVEKQPLEYPSAGSTFKRPEGYFAAKLIEDGGLKGYREGDAMVSEKHAGFVVNVGNATAEDVIKLTDHVKMVVQDKYKVTLELEVRKLGF